MQAQQQHISMRDYVRMIRKRWKVVALFGLLGLAMGIWSWKNATPAYESSSKVFIERQSGYVISAAVSSLGTNTGTKQQLQFLATDTYQQMARSLTDLAPRIGLDLQDKAKLDDISTVIQSDVLNSGFVTPVRLVMYGLPSPSLLSFQQEASVMEAPVMGENLRMLGRMTIGPDFDISQGWMRGRPGPSDQAVWNNLRRVAASPMLRSWQAMGLTDAAARQRLDTDTGRSEADRLIGMKLRMAADLVGTLTALDDAAETAQKRGKNLRDLHSSPEVLQAVGEVMTSKFVSELRDGPGPLNWFALSPSEKRVALDRTMEAWRVMERAKPSPHDAVWDFGGKEVADSSDIIGITVTAPSPAEARLASNAMAAVMVWEDRMSKVAEAERSIRFLTRQLGTPSSGATKALRERENQLTEYRKRHQLFNAEEEIKIALGRVNDLEARISDADSSLRAANAALNRTQTELSRTKRFTMAPIIQQNPLVQNLRAQLIQIETDLEGMRAQGYTDEYPPLMNKKAQYDNLKKRLTEQMLTSVTEQYSVDPVHADLTMRAASYATERVSLEARRAALNGKLKEFEARFNRLPEKQAEMVRLMRSYSLAERQYNELYGRLMDSWNNKAMRQGNAKVVEVAKDPGIRTQPRRRSIFVALVLGLFLGSLCALALSSTDTHLRTVEDVRRELDIPVLAHLPAIPPGNGLVVEAMPAAAVTEGFRSLRSTLRFMHADKPIRTLATTSTRAAEGKSTVVANLAASLAQAGLTITAVDADLRRPRLASFFGIAGTAGLVDALSSLKPARQVRQATRIPGLYVVPSGAVPSNPAELLDNGRINRALLDLQDGNDMIIVDTPPVGVVTDAALVGSATDATILVIESGTVEPDEARAALARLTENARANVIGVVLVGGDAPISEDYVRYVSAANGHGNGADLRGGSRRPKGRLKV